jgi:hypothetical protein
MLKIYTPPIFQAAKITILLMIMCSCFLPAQAHADYAVKYAKVDCMPKLGVFTITGINVWSKFFKMPEEERMKLEEEYNLKNGEYTKKIGEYNLRNAVECEIANKTYRIDINYSETKSTGMCGSDSRAKIKIYRDGEIFKEIANFHMGCKGEFGPRYIEFNGGRFLNCPDDTRGGACAYYDTLLERNNK